MSRDARLCVREPGDRDLARLSCPWLGSYFFEGGFFVLKVSAAAFLPADFQGLLARLLGWCLRVFFLKAAAR